MIPVTSATDIDAIVSRIKNTNNIYDISETEWYEQRKREDGTSTMRVGILGGDGTPAADLGSFSSDEELQAIMLKNKFIQAHTVTDQTRQRLLNKTAATVPVVKYQPNSDIPLIPPSTPPPPTLVYPAPVAPAAPPPSAAPVQIEQAPPPIIRDKRIPDFRPIKMEWLPVKPEDPQIIAHFSSELGEFETYYHRTIKSDAIVYLLYDKRCKFGRFVPKLTGLTTLTFDGQEYKGTLWLAAKFEIGVVEITPFIIALNPEEEEEQDNY